ncbi:hypothetical protein BOX15_Mlig033340g1 [Macrostomum lignano]|uniref:Fibronectin type-III domain-containing protein n=1 Tax=Macrostomum lignano TaxID=282301 RepID=A0A267F4K8_9PLAT|nr:hypothetical protein BOX15_Mlig033340g1 [Macrostomum lignano]
MVGRRFEPSRASGWQNVSLVVGDAVAVEEVRSGHIYQFRVAAVSRLGTRGFGAPSAPYSSEAPPQAPGAPSSLSEGRLRIYSSGRVSVRVHWEPPTAHELPVHLYQIRWAKDHGFVNSDGSVLSVTRFSNSRPANARSYLIQNLEPGASYKVEVRAASLWGDETLLGPPNSIYVSTPQPARTPQLPSSHDRPGSTSGGDNAENDEACSAAVSASSYDQLTAAQPGSATPLHIQQPLYDNGQLTVRMLILGVSVGSEETLYRVLWRRRVCIDSPGNGKLFQMTVVAERGYFQLTQLQFNCRYFVRLIPMDSPTSKRRLRNITACFRTPSCDEVKLASGSPPPEQCPAALETQLPEPPGRIQVRQLAQTGSGNDLLSYLVTWTPAASAGTTASDSSTSHRRRRGRGTSISGYCVVWGPRLEEPVSQSSYLAASAGGRGAASAAARSAPAASAKSSGVVGGADGGNVNGGLYPQMDPDRAVTRVLPPTNTSLVVEDLQPGKLYIVQVHSQALANGQLLVSRSSSYFFATPPGLSGDGGGDAGSRQLLGRGGEIDKYVRINSESRLGSNSARVWLSARTISLCLLACLTAVNLYAA